MKPQPCTRRELSTVLLHEYRRASLALGEFMLLASELLSGNVAVDIRLGTYDAYARFVHHLYEFYKGCIRTDGPTMSQADGKAMDQIVQFETTKLMRNRADRIARGDGAKWDISESYYRQEVPAVFAKDFREVRNGLAHTSLSRSDPKDRISLPDFYVRYHRFVYLLYEEAYWLWHAKDEASIDWKEIGRFEEAVKLSLKKRDAERPS